MIKRILFILTYIISLNIGNSQENTAQSVSPSIIPLDIAVHNAVKYNRFMFNPTFSFVRENNRSISAFNRNPRSSFNDNSKTYYINYSGRFRKNMGLGVGLFQQNLGIFRSFGGVLNYAYNLELDRDMNFTFGINLNYFQSSLKSNLDIAQSNDEVITNYQNNSTLLLNPGVNFNYKDFDFGVSVNNLIAYDITNSNLSTDSFSYIGHIMYSKPLYWQKDDQIRGMLYASKSGQEDLVYGGNVLYEIPKFGWVKLGYNSFYGSAIGIGANIAKMVSLEYTIEPGFGSKFDVAEFGATHEFVIAYNFSKKRNVFQKRRKTISPKKSLEKEAEIRKLKEEKLAQIRLQDSIYKVKKDSIAKINKEKIIRQAEKTQDSLLNTVPSMDRRAFNKLLEGLVNMGQDAKKVLNDPDLSSSKEFTSKNQFIKYANKARSAAKYATKYLDGYPEGYYLIANVFKVDLYSDRFNKKLIELGFKDSRIIFNPQNKYQYVSIAYYTDKNQADTAYLNNLGDRYFGEMWILRILKPKAKVESSKKLLKENKLLKNDN